MQIIEQVDVLGRKRRYMVEDGDVDPADAAETGVDVGVPDLSQLDWNEIMVELSNKLYDAKLFTPEDLMARGDATTSILRIVIGRKINKLYGV